MAGKSIQAQWEATDMYMPVDPKSVNGMWDKLLSSLSSQNTCLVVSDGQFNKGLQAVQLSRSEAEELLGKLKSRDYVRVGSAHMSPVPAHFSLDLTSGVGRLMELISLSPDEDRLKNDISLICQFSFFENKDMKELIIPFVIQGVEDPELTFEVDESAGVTCAYRK
jgi:hypothetical protein